MNKEEFILYIKKLGFKYDSKHNIYKNYAKSYSIKLGDDNLVNMWTWGNDDGSYDINSVSYLENKEKLKQIFNIELRKMKINNLFI